MWFIYSSAPTGLLWVKLAHWKPKIQTYLCSLIIYSSASWIYITAWLSHLDLRVQHTPNSCVVLGVASASEVWFSLQNEPSAPKDKIWSISKPQQSKAGLDWHVTSLLPLSDHFSDLLGYSAFPGSSCPSLFPQQALPPALHLSLVNSGIC